MAEPVFFSSDHVLGRTLRLPFEVTDGRLRLATRGTVTGGAFKLRDTVTNETTADIAYNASAADVVAALSALSGIRSADLTGSGGALGSAAVVIECVGRLRGYKAWERFELYSHSLTGSGSPAVDLSPQPQDLTDYTLTAMAKVSRTDADSAAVFSLTEADGISITSPSDGQGEFEITPTHQSGVTWEESGTWVLALKGVDTANSNRTYDLAEGYIKWVGPVDR